MDRNALVSHIPHLRRYARALTGNAWAADDLVQDTLERACGKWRLWLPGTDLRAWLFTVMHNLFASQRRRPGLPEYPGDPSEAAVHGPALESGHEQRIDLQRCLLLLPEEQRAVVLLVALEDMSYAQVARVLGIPAGTVMSRLSRGRAHLRELMEGQAPPSARPALRRLK